MRIKGDILNQMYAHAQRELPFEACGYLAMKDGIVVKCYELYNVDQSPEHYGMDPKEQFATVKAIREEGLQVAAVYHSHPETPARPSEEDIRLAYDPNISHVIVSLAEGDPYAKSFLIKKGEVTPEEILVED